MRLVEPLDWGEDDFTTCMCGSPVDSHGWDDGHSPVSVYDYYSSTPISLGEDTVNLTTAIMLVNKGVRSVKVQYDPDNAKNNNYNFLFKSLDPELKKDDYVIVPTNTRHGFTVGKVIEIDFRVDFNDAGTKWGWVVGKVDEEAYKNILAQEEKVIARIGEAEENRMRKQLSESMGLGEIDFSDLDVVKGTPVPQIASVRGATQPEPPPVAPAYRDEPMPIRKGASEDDLPIEF